MELYRRRGEQAGLEPHTWLWQMPQTTRKCAHPPNGEEQLWWEKEKIIFLQNLLLRVWGLLEEVRSGVVASATLSDPKNGGYFRQPRLVPITGLSSKNSHSNFRPGLLERAGWWPEHVGLSPEDTAGPGPMTEIGGSLIGGVASFPSTPWWLVQPNCHCWVSLVSTAKSLSSPKCQSPGDGQGQVNLVLLSGPLGREGKSVLQIWRTHLGEGLFFPGPHPQHQGPVLLSCSLPSEVEPHHCG